MFIVGRILKPQGVKGELKILSISPKPERFKNLKSVFIQREKIDSYSIESVRISNKFVFLKLVEINNREEAENLRGYDILIDKSELENLLPNEFYIHDLIGCKVISDKGINLGELVNVVQYSSNDVYIVKNSIGKEFLIPAIKDVIKQVSVAEKTIVVHLLEGLID